MPEIVPPNASQPITDKLFNMQQVFRTWTQRVSRALVGMPEGGAPGEALIKSSANDYDTEWSAIAAGAVTSVFSRTGAIVAVSGDYNADQISDAATTNKFVTNGANNLTSGEVAQLANIDTTTVSATQWGYVGGADQAVKTTDDVTFDVITGTGIADFSAAGVYFGTVAAANLLDDYEEGQAVVTATPSSSGTITLSSAGEIMAYTKIGRKVTVTGQVIVSSVSSPVGSFAISLPFVSATMSDKAGVVSCSIAVNASASVNVQDFVGIVNEASSSLTISLATGNTVAANGAEQMVASTSIYIEVTYFTAT